MTKGAKKIIYTAVLLIGAALWLSQALRFEREGKLDFVPNIAALNGSPYGKVLVLVMQGKIDVYFHEGQRHEEEALLNDGEDDGLGSDGEAAHEHGEDCGCDAHSSKDERAEEFVPSHLKAKQYIKTLVAYTHRKTDSYVLTPAHKKFIQGKIEDQIKFAYELDPSNYANYEGYFLYLMTDSLGKKEADPEAAVALSRRTLAYCKMEELDPAVWLTAASAAHDIGYYISLYPEQFTEKDVIETVAEFAFCLKKFEMLLDDSFEKGFLVTNEQLNKMLEEAALLRTRLKAQEVYLMRAMREKNSDSHE